MLTLMLNDSLEFFKKNFLYIASLLLPFLIPLALFDAVYQLAFVGNSKSFGLQIPVMILGIIVYPFYQVALIFGIAYAVKGEYPKKQVLWAKGGQYWISLVAVNVLFSCAVVFGLMLLVLPGIYFGIRFLLAKLNVVLDNETPIDAMKSSWSQSDPVFGTLFFGMLIIGAVITIPFIIMFSYLGDVAQPLYSILVIIPTILHGLLNSFFTVFLMRVRHYLLHNE